MSLNDEHIAPSSDSFWELDNYRKTVNRHEAGNKLSNDLMQLVQDRADIEKHYAKSLRAWSKKWNDSIEKGPEYGTTEAAWRAVLTEAEKIADIHLDVKEKLINNVQNDIKSWKSDHYHKSTFGSSKETKEFEESFKKAQKPWAKRLSKLVKCKKDYHSACRQEKTALHQEANARGDSGVSGDQLKKLQDKSEKLKKEVEVTKEKYESALNELNGYNAKYMEDMTEVFQKSQDLEGQRLQFFRDTLLVMHKCIDVSRSEELCQIYDQLKTSIGQADYQKDLRWWSNNHGVDMPMNWPVFEDYAPEMRKIHSKENKSSIIIDGITLTSLQQKADIGPPLSAKEVPRMGDNYHQMTDGVAMHDSNEAYTNNTFEDNQNPSTVNSCRENIGVASGGGMMVQEQSASGNGIPQIVNGGAVCQNPFGDDDWQEMDPVDSVTVRALYDYSGQEDDELSFKTGDVFLKLSNKDDQGWCTGQKDGKKGLYPDNYVEVIGN